MEETWIKDEYFSDEDEDETRAYEESSWPKINPTGYSYKGKKEAFVKAVKNLELLMRNGHKKESANISIKILETKQIPNGKEKEIEIEKGKEKGNASIKFYGPSKKGCTVIVNKTKKNDVKFAVMLALDVVKPFLDNFIAGEKGNDPFKTTISKAMQKALGKSHNCNFCDKTFASERTLNIHIKRNHAMEIISCSICEYKTSDENGLKLHMKNKHGFEEEMEVEEIVTEEKKILQNRSKNNDRKILEKRKRQEEEEQIENKQKSFEKADKKQRNSIKTKKKKVAYDIIDDKPDKTNANDDKLPPNVTPVPTNIVHLVKNGSLQYIVAGDGNCGFKAGAAHIFHDPQYGIPFRKVINNHIADRFRDYYCNRISFPCVRKIGARGEIVTFNIGEENKYLDFLRTEKAAWLWTEFEDL